MFRRVHGPCGPAVNPAQLNDKQFYSTAKHGLKNVQIKIKTVKNVKNVTKIKKRL